MQLRQVALTTLLIASAGSAMAWWGYAPYYGPYYAPAPYTAPYAYNPPVTPYGYGYGYGAPVAPFAAPVPQFEQPPARPMNEEEFKAFIEKRQKQAEEHREAMMKQSEARREEMDKMHGEQMKMMPNPPRYFPDADLPWMQRDEDETAADK